jgi:hypothetical protein
MRRIDHQSPWRGSLGFAVANAGDVDRDGINDIAAAAISDVPAPAVYVFSGATGTRLHRLPDGFQVGVSLAGGSDVNGDGHADLLVGGIEDGTRTGYASVYSGKDGVLLRRVWGTAQKDHFGASVSFAGDVNRDGIDDLLIGAPQRQTGPGYAVILSGRDGRFVRGFTGFAFGDEFGASVAGLGDVDGDGYPDAAVGAPMSRARGYIGGGLLSVVSGKDGRSLQALAGSGTMAQFGKFVAFAGDVNADGSFDMLVSGALELSVFSHGNIARMGRGCGATVPPDLTALSAPRLGQPWAVFGTNGPQAGLGVLLFSAPPRIPTSFGSSCAAYVMLGRSVVSSVVATDMTGQWGLALLLPPDHSLNGVQIAAQTFFVLHGTLSNGLYAVLAP